MTFLAAMINCNESTGLTFLDAESGSGIFSLAAGKLGFRVHSFDFDKDSDGVYQRVKKPIF